MTESNQPASAGHPGPDTRTFMVSDISCDHCKVAIEREVELVAGVRDVSVDVAAKSVTVVGGDDVAIRAAIADAGYAID